MATKTARKRAKHRSAPATVEALTLQCVFRVGTHEFPDEASARAFQEQYSLRGTLSALVAKALENAPVRGRKALKDGANFLLESIVTNPTPWRAALGDAPASAGNVPAAPAPAPARKRATKRAAAAPAASAAPKKKRIRRTRAQIAADEAAAAGTSAPAPAPAPTPAAAPTLPPPPV